jgi:hypothetical protein
MTDTATGALAVKDAFYTAARSLFDPGVVQVSFGVSTDRRDLNQIVAFLEVESQLSQGPLSASNRSRDEDVDLHVVVSVSGSGDTDDQNVTETAYGLLRALDLYTRKTDTTLGGTCMWCFLVAHQSFGYTSVEKLAAGRLCEIEATFRARVRITGG